MKYDVLNNVESYSKKHHRKKLWLRIVSVLGCLVVFCTTYALILPAITMENETFCGIEEHIHNEECYNQITEVLVLECQAAPHEHIKTCYDEEENPICGYADFFVHTHDDNCFDADGNLVCLLEEIPEHEHTEECWPIVGEIEAHEHDEDCWEETTELTCTLDEADGHIHEDSCYTVVENLICEEADDDIYNNEENDADKILVCDIEESEGHKHNADCTVKTAELICEEDESEGHVHGDECYTETVDYETLVCTLDEIEGHKHDENCYSTDSMLVCVEAESEGHSHGDDCYDEEGALVCTTEESEGHTHGDECYAEMPRFDCTLDEIEGHTHTDECYAVTKTLTCETEEIEGHVHTDDCYEITEDFVCDLEETDGHIHGNECYEVSEVIPEEHIHDENCYTEAETLICEIEESEEHTHGDECYAWEDVLTCEFAEESDNILTDEDALCGMRQAILHKHNEKLCYDEEGNLICGMIEVLEHVHDEDCFVTVEIAAEDIPLTCGLEEDADHEHNFLCWGEWELVCEQMEHIHENECFVDHNLYRYSDENVYVEVQLPEDSKVPNDAVLTVTPITEGEEYENYLAQAEEAVDGTVAKIALYDISFNTPDGEYIPVSENAKVSMAFAESPVDTNADVQVLHFDEEEELPVQLEDFNVDEKEIEMIVETVKEAVQDEEVKENLLSAVSEFIANVFTAEEAAETVTEAVTETRTVVEFETPGFSTFAVIELTSMYQTVEGIAGLENKSYIIVGVNVDGGNFNGDGTPKALPVMTSVKNDANNRLIKRQTDSVVYNDNKVTSVALTDYTNAVWTFEKAGSDTYYIKSSGEQYLSIPASEQLTLSDNKQEFRVVPATNTNASNGDVTNAVCIETVDQKYRVVLASNDPIVQDFTSFGTTIDDRQTHLVLVEYTEPETIDLSNLVGKNYIIVGVNNNQNDVVTKTNLPVLIANETLYDNKDPALGNRTTEDVAYVNNHVIAVTLVDTDKALWTFEKADGNDNAYYIKNTTTKTYLHLGDRSLTLSEQPQAIEALVAGGFYAGDDQNAIYLRTADEPHYYVNLVGNGNFTCFFGYNPGGNDDRGNHLVLIEYEEHDVTMPVISDAEVNNLAGKKLVITNIGGYAITGNTLNIDNGNEYDDRLAAEKVDAIAADQSTVTISSGNSADLVWEFEATGTDGQYYIKHVATGKYLHIYETARNNLDRPLTLEETATPQAIEVLSAKDDNNPNAVWIRCPISNLYHGGDGGNSEDYNCIELYSGDPAKGFGVWNKSQGGLPDSSKFLLSEYTDLPMMDTVDATVAANNLNGRKMVITAANYNTAMSNNTTTIGGRGMLEAQEAAEKNGTVGVVAGTNLVDVSWKFTSAGEPNQYYITDSTGNYLNINGTSVTLSADNKQPISVYENNDGTFVLYVTEGENNYLLDYGWNDYAFSAWGRKPDAAEGNNKFNLTPVEQFDKSSKVVTNLDGKTLALISIYDANPKKGEGQDYTPKLALTSQDTYDVNGNSTNGLQGVEVELSGTTGKAYTFDDNQFTNNQELWTFEAVGDKLGVYYIKAANGQYLNLGDGSATVSENKQEITVLSDTYVGRDSITYEVVYLRATVDGKEVYLRREYNGYGEKLFGDDAVDADKGNTQRNFVLAQPSMFYIDVDKWLNLETEDWLYKPQFKDGTTFKEYSFVDNGTLPVSGELGAEPVENTRTVKTQHFVSFNFAESMDPYYDRYEKGRDFPQAYMASWAPDLMNEYGYIDRDMRPEDTNENDEFDVTDDPDTRAAFIEKLKEKVYDPVHFTGESPYWGVEYELTHYEVILPDGTTMKDANGNVVKFAPGAEYTVTADGKIAINDVNEKTYYVPFGSTFKAQYTEFSDILTFYINLHGMVKDVTGDIQSRYIEDFTLGLAIAHIYYPKQYAGDEEGYDNTNAYINALFKGAYGENVADGQMHAVIDGFITRENTLDNGEGDYNPEYRDDNHVKDPAYPRYLSAEMTPAPGASATALAAHVLDYVRTVPDIDIRLKNYVNGNSEETPTLNHTTIDTASFDIRWYVVKDQGDSWHIDGVTVGKTDPVAVTKTFYGLAQEVVADRVDYSKAETIDNYQIFVSLYNTDPVLYYNMLPYSQEYYDGVIVEKDGEETCTDDNLYAAYDELYTYNGGSNPYNWTMSAILGQKFLLEEKNYDFQYTDESGTSLYYDHVSKVTVKDKDGNISTDTFGTTAEVTGGTTASVEFNNYYTQHNTGMFIVKKISSVTGLPLAGAVFTLTGTSKNGTVVNSTEKTDADGEASFYNLEDGTYYLKETKAPEGFAASQTTWTITVANNGKVTYNGTATDGNLLYDFNEGKEPTFKPLVITNAPVATTVKVIKQFVGISKDQVDSLAGNYKIEMQPNHDENDTATYSDYTLTLGQEGSYVTPVVSADGLTYTWTLTNVPEIVYTVTESNFKLKNYVTTVSVEGFEFKDEDDNVIYTTEVTEPGVANDTATFTATFDQEYEDGFTIYNSYANDFSMQIKKVDSENQNPLSGATFEVYGAHFISTATENVEVAGQTLYYLDTVTTDANGMATFNGWTDDDGVFHKLVLGYPYALVETKAPDGYNLLTEPIYLGVVNAEGVTDLDKEANPNLINLDFSNGVYTITVENTPGYELPETGGSGTLLYTYGGLSLMIGGASLLLYKKKKRRKEGSVI